MEGVLTVDDYLKGISIRAVELLRPVEGDVVVVTVEERLNDAQIHNLGTCLKLLMPPGVKVGVCHGGMKLQIVRPEKESEPAQGLERKVKFREFT